MVFPDKEFREWFEKERDAFVKHEVDKIPFPLDCARWGFEQAERQNAERLVKLRKILICLDAITSNPVAKVGIQEALVLVGGGK